MSLVQYTGPDGVKFIKPSTVDILNERREEIVEMSKPCMTSINKMTGGDTLEIIDISFEGQEDLSGCFG